MSSSSLQLARRLIAGTALIAALVGYAGAPAQARIFVGVGIPFYGPGFYPYYPPPPVYYAPPPVVYTPPPRMYTPAPAAVPADGGQSCYAGPYVCPMDRRTATGGSCYCPGNGGQRIWGRAN